MFRKLKVIRVDQRSKVETVFKKIKQFNARAIEKNDIYNLYRVCGHKVRVYHNNVSYVEFVDDEKWEQIEINGETVNYHVNKYGGIKGPKGYIMWSPDSYGYCKVGLTINGKYKTVRSHRLVAIAFIENPENKPQVRFIDHNKQNNYVYNLEWSTSSECMGKYWSKFTRKATKSLTTDDVNEIKKLWESDRKYNYQMLGHLFGVHQRTINRVVNNKYKVKE